ncbi:hypothetical protein A2U01_0116838, partial [Trifolium medium]|nr:hypothetical protein [Trifolium medium]
AAPAAGPPSPTAVCRRKIWVPPPWTIAPAPEVRR